MSTKIILIVTTVLYCVSGLWLSFFPAETARQFGAVDATSTILPFQLLGAAYLGFGVLNWLSRASKIGGIYGRPLVFANFMHLFVGVFAVLKFATGPAVGTPLPWVAVAAFSILAGCFGYLLFGR